MNRSRLLPAVLLATIKVAVDCTAPLWRSWRGGRPWPLSLQVLRRGSTAEKGSKGTRPAVWVFASDYPIRPMCPALERVLEEARQLGRPDPLNELLSAVSESDRVGPAPVSPDAVFPRPTGPVLEVRALLPGSDWGVFQEGRDAALFAKEDKDPAIDKAINQLAGSSGGEVWVMDQIGKIAIRIEAPSQTLSSRSEIVAAAREISERESLPFPGLAAERWGDAVDDPEFAVALWRVWSHQPWTMSSLVFDMGTAGQYGPYVFWSSYRGGPLTIERCPSTAAAMRRFGELAARGPNPGVL